MYLGQIVYYLMNNIYLTIDVADNSSKAIKVIICWPISNVPIVIAMYIYIIHLIHNIYLYARICI